MGRSGLGHGGLLTLALGLRLGLADESLPEALEREDRAGGQADELLGDATHQEALDARAAVAAEHEEVHPRRLDHLHEIANGVTHLDADLDMAAQRRHLLLKLVGEVGEVLLGLPLETLEVDGRDLLVGHDGGRHHDRIDHEREGKLGLVGGSQPSGVPGREDGALGEVHGREHAIDGPRPHGPVHPIRTAHGEHRARREAHDLFGHAPDHHPAQAAPPVRPHHDEVDVVLFGVAEDDRGRVRAGLLVLNERHGLIGGAVVALGERELEVGRDVLRRDAEVVEARGSTIPVEIASNSVEIGDQQYRLAIIRDITTRRQRVEELERNRDFLQQIQEAVNLGGWAGRLDSKSGTWSDEVYRILGLPQDTEPTAEAAFECFHPEDRPIIEEAFTALTTNGTPYDLELRLKSNGGTTQWVRTRGQPQYDDDTGELVAVRGVIQDITDDKQREQDLSLQKSAIKQAPVGVTISDATHPDNPIIYANDGFEKLTGYAKAQAMGQNCRFLQGERTSEETRAEIRQAVEAEEFIQATILNYRSNQTPFWNQLTISPVTGENTDEVTHFIGIQEDVTAQERRERLIEVLNRVLRHNLRNSMTVIRGHAVEIAERTDGELARMAEKIKQQSDQLIELSEKAIAFEKTVDDSDLFAARDICEDVEAVAAALQKKYPDSEIRVELAGDGQVMALERVRVALKELGENAITHGSDPVTFRVETADDGGVMVQVEDAGEGLPRNERVVLQEGQEEPLVHGSSIGLWTVNWIVTGMGGEVSTAVDGGTTVTLSFPPVSGEELPASATDRRTPLNFD